MSKKFEKLRVRARQIESEIKTETTRLFETEAALEKSTGEIGEATASLQGFLHAKNTVEVDSCEKELAELKKGRDRAELLIPALREKLDLLNADLISARRDLDSKFSELAGKWLEAEVGLYDAAAKVLVLKLRRLFVCFELLKEKDFSGTWREIVGPGHDALNQLKIPILKGFIMAEFNQPGRLLTFSRDDVDAVHDEIIK